MLPSLNVIRFQPETPNHTSNLTICFHRQLHIKYPISLSGENVSARFMQDPHRVNDIRAELLTLIGSSQPRQTDQSIFIGSNIHRLRKHSLLPKRVGQHSLSGASTDLPATDLIEIMFNTTCRTNMTSVLEGCCTSVSGSVVGQTCQLNSLQEYLGCVNANANASSLATFCQPNGANRKKVGVFGLILTALALSSVTQVL